MLVKDELVPPNVSVPSSKIIVIEETVESGAMGGKAMASSKAVQRSLIQLELLLESMAGGELHPTKWFTASLVTTLKRGAPAPQCEPLGQWRPEAFANRNRAR